MQLQRDIGMDKDNFQKSRIFNETDSLVNYILNILVMRPGNIPGMPELGVNIGQYVHSGMQGKIDVNQIKGLIISNCEQLMPYLIADKMVVAVVKDQYGKDVLLIKIAVGVEQDSRQQKDIYYAFYRNELNELEFNFLVDNDL